MSILYVGRVANQYGRPLWEIVLNLKDFGKGRLVTRSTFNFRYPETTFYRIVDVEPAVIDYKDKMLGKILVDTSFKHIKQDLSDIGMYGFKPDFHLIPKHEEEKFLNSIQIIEKPPVVHPRNFQFPPLWQELIKRDFAAKGATPSEEDLLCKAIYDPTTQTVVAEQGQTPSFTFEKFSPVSPQLYANCKLKT